MFHWMQIGKNQACKALYNSTFPYFFTFEYCFQQNMAPEQFELRCWAWRQMKEYAKSFQKIIHDDNWFIV